METFVETRCDEDLTFAVAGSAGVAGEWVEVEVRAAPFQVAFVVAFVAEAFPVCSDVVVAFVLHRLVLASSSLPVVVVAAA